MRTLILGTHKFLRILLLLEPPRWDDCVGGQTRGTIEVALFSSEKWFLNNGGLLNPKSSTIVYFSRCAPMGYFFPPVGGSYVLSPHTSVFLGEVLSSQVEEPQKQNVVHRVAEREWMSGVGTPATAKAPKPFTEDPLLR